MLRKIFVPKENFYTLRLPDDFVGKTVEVIAFTTDDATAQKIPAIKKTYEDAIAFFKSHAVDFSKIGKWSREDLYE